MIYVTSIHKILILLRCHQDIMLSPWCHEVTNIKILIRFRTWVLSHQGPTIEKPLKILKDSGVRKNEFWSLLNLEQLKQLEKMFLVVLVEEHLIKLMKRIIKQLSTLGTLLTFLNFFNYQDINHLITLT